MTTFSEFSLEIKEKVKVSSPIHIRLKSISCDGTTTFDGVAYTILINSELSLDAKKQTLLHEIAHVKTIDNAYKHKGAWGKIYAQIYRRMFE